MIATNVRRLGLYLMVAFAVVSASITWWQVIEAPNLATRADNPEVLAARRSLLRGTIFDASGQVLASSTVVDGLSIRTYSDPAFTHVIGYSSLRFGSTGLERTYEDILVGQTDPNPIRDFVGDILDRQPQPRDLTLTIDRRLQDFAAAAAGVGPGRGGRARPAHGRGPGARLEPDLRRDADLGRSGGRAGTDGRAAQRPRRAAAGPRPPGPLRPGLDHEGLHRRRGPRRGRDHARHDVSRPAAAGDRGLRRRRLHDSRARPRRHPAGHVAALRVPPGLEQHLLRPRRARAGGDGLPRLRAALRVLRAREASGRRSARWRSRRALSPRRSKATARRSAGTSSSPAPRSARG